MLVQAKSNLARLMATENLTIEERNVQTAYFDPKNRILTVPILNGNLSPELYDLLLGHEVGHALETPADGWHHSVKNLKVEKSILNVCEDIRIEKKIKRRFPGLKPSFSRGYRELMDMDFFGINDTEIDSLNFIDRINIYTKGGTYLNINFSDEERVLLEEAEKTETFNEVIDIAKKIQEFMQVKAKEEQTNETGNKKSEKMDDEFDGEESEESSNGDNSENEGKNETDKDGESKPEGEDKKSKGGGGSQKTTNKGEENTKDKVAEKSGGKEKEDVSSKTDKNFREKEKELFENSSKCDFVYSNIPDINSEKWIVTHEEIFNDIKKYNDQVQSNGKRLNTFSVDPLIKEFVKYKNQSNKVVSYLVKEFEMRKNAEKQSRAKVSKTGELNMNRIYEYKFTDDIFKRMTNVPNGKSHGLVMFIDWSGSMEDHIGPTIKQLLNLVLFCKKVNIPYEVYGFTSNAYELLNNCGKELQKPKIGDLKVNNHFCLINLLSSKMNVRDFMKMASVLYNFGVHRGRSNEKIYYPDSFRLGGTPLNSAIVTAFDIVPKFKERNKLQIVNTLFLTDGESSNLDGRFYDITVYKQGYVNADSVPNNRRRSLFRDPVSKAVVEVNRGQYSVSGAETEALLKLLKQRLNCNLIGFFVARRRDINIAIDNFSKDEDAIRLRSQFAKDNTAVITTYGYDEYYMLRSEDLNTEDEDDFEVKGDTTRSLVSAFSKYTGGKVSSRIILNRFIKLIA